MNKRIIVHTAAVLLALGTLPAFAADADTPARGPIPFADMDTDGDGYVSSDEFRAAHATRREQMQAENEARRAEREAERETRREQNRNMDESEHYSAMDADHDGRVSHEEFEAFREQRMEQRAQQQEQRRQEQEQRKQEHMEKREEMMKQHEEQTHDIPAAPARVN